MAPQDSQNCGRDFAKRKQTDADFAANSLLRMVIIDIESNTSLGGLTLDPAGMHCPWYDAFVIVLGPIFRRALNPKFVAPPVLLRFDDFFILYDP